MISAESQNLILDIGVEGGSDSSLYDLRPEKVTFSQSFNLCGQRALAQHTEKNSEPSSSYPDKHLEKATDSRLQGSCSL